MSVVLFVIHLVVATTISKSSALPLSSLPSSCAASAATVDHFGSPRLRVVLSCNSRAVRITGPDSLEGIVDIQTPAQALEYVRFFSVERTFNLFDFGGLVEIAGIGEARVTADGRYLIPEEYEDAGKNIYHAPEVITRDGGAAVRAYKIRRVVVATNGKIYDIEELVSANGSYAVLRRTELLSEASRIGIVHLGEI